MRKRKPINNYRKPPPSRQEAKCILAVVEGATEELYFKQIKRSLRLPALVLEYTKKDCDAGKLLESLRRRRRINKKKYDAVWFIFDCEIPQSPNLEESCRLLCKEKHHEIGITNPCIEYWFLLHFGKTTRAFSTNAEVAKVLNRKSMDRFGIHYIKTCEGLTDFIQQLLTEPLKSLKTACDNADKALKAAAVTSDWPDCIKQLPSTNLHLLVNELLKEYDKKAM